MPVWNKGFVGNPDNPGNSKLMLWIRDVALKHTGDECLIWPFTRLTDGYGGIGRADKALRAHRYICQWIHGDPPTPKYHAAHSCGRGHEGCVSPLHLSWKTPSENYKEGQKHPRHKLTEANVAEIRRLTGMEKNRITAQRFGVTEATIRKIRAFKLWPTGKYSTGGFKPRNRAA